MPNYRKLRRRRLNLGSAGFSFANLNSGKKMINDIIKQKRDTLLKLGWVECNPTFDWDYFFDVSSKNLGKDLGYLISEVAENSANFFGLFGEKVDTAKTNFVSSICPPVYTPTPPPATAFISATWPFNLTDYSSHLEAAFEELTYRTILKIVEYLGAPLSVYQSLGNGGEVVLELDPSNFVLEDSLILDKLILSWKDVYVTVEVSQSWNDNGAIASYNWTLYSNNIREYSSKVLHNIGLEINPTTYQLGNLDPEFHLNSFPDYIRGDTYRVEVDMGFKVGAEVTSSYPERYNLLIVGPPGYGKTRWSQAYAAEVLAPKGYLVLVIDYSTLQDLVIPTYIDKVCIIVNDADTLALDRGISKRGETEQVLSWLDGTRTTYIKPFYMSKRTSVITIMTANSVEKWDEAALRRGRIHKQLTFDQIKLSDI